MSIAKPFTFVANTHAKSSEVNANFDTVYSQVNTNISTIAQNATDIDNLENNKADINGSSSQRFAVADAITDTDAINKRSLRNAIGNFMDYISGFTITKDSGSPNDTIIVSEGSAYDSTKSVVLSLVNSLSKQNTNQAANATYYIYIIGSSNGSQTDILISPNQVTPTLPTGYSLYRQIGNYTTDSDNKIDNISYYGESDTSDKSIGTVLNAVMPDFSRISSWVATEATVPYDALIIYYNAYPNDPISGTAGMTVWINGNCVYSVRANDYEATTGSFYGYVSKGVTIQAYTGRNGARPSYSYIVPLKGVNQ